MAAALRFAMLLVGFWAAASPAMAAGSPNVLVFLVDDLGWTDWQRNGGEHGSSFYETPNMNRLAREGVTFTNAYSSSAVCSPTRNALLTGKHPARTRMTQWLPGYVFDGTLSEPRWQRTLDEAEVTLPEAFRAAGYATGFVGKWHLGNRYSASADPLRHGFDTNVGGNHLGAPNPSYGYFAKANGSFGLPGLRAGSAAPGDYLTDRLTDAALEFIDRHAGGERPFFLLLSHFGVHVPLEAPAERVAMYWTKPPAGGHSNPTYAAMVASVDASLGRILYRLEMAGIRDDTIIVFASDNGGSSVATSNAPLRASKGFVYEGGIRTPLIVSWTGNRRIPTGTSSEAVVVSHDIYPTLLDLTKVPGDPLQNRDFDGASFRKALEAKDPDRGAVFWHYPHVSPQSKEASGGRYLSAVRIGDWKLIYFYEDQAWELYDLAGDVGETTNLVGACPGVANRLGEMLVDWLIDMDAQLPLDASSGEAVALPAPVAAPQPGVVSLRLGRLRSRSDPDRCLQRGAGVRSHRCAGAWWLECGPGEGPSGWKNPRRRPVRLRRRGTPAAEGGSAAFARNTALGARLTRAWRGRP